MTKHIAGIILFTFIVGTSAVVAGLLYEAPRKIKSFTVRDDYRSYKRKRRKRRCRKKRRPRVFRNSAVAPPITQAVFDRRAQKLTISHGITAREMSKRSIERVYYFYVRDQFGARHVRTEKPKHVRTTFRINTRGASWNTDLDSDGNIYVMSEYRSVRGGSTTPPPFDVAKATPVLIKDIN